MNIEYIKEKDYNRIIIISDIHAHYYEFISIINTLSLKDDDLLIINGDIINKGEYSLKLLRLIMEMDKKENIIVTKGNHEYFIYNNIFKKGDRSRFLNFLKNGSFKTIIHDMAFELGIKISECEDFYILSESIKKKYKKELSFINNLITYIEMDDHIVVHSAYEDYYDKEHEFIKNDSYIYDTNSHDKRIIIGHLPSSNLRTKDYNNEPYFDKEKNVVLIDGGIGVKLAGEINAYIIERKDNKYNYSFIQSNSFIDKVIKKSHYFESEEKFLINYPDFEVELIEKGEIFSKIRHLKTEKIISVFTCLIKRSRGKLYLKVVYINRFFNLKIGTNIKLVYSFKDCHLIKYKNKIGWIMKNQI